MDTCHVSASLRMAKQCRVPDLKPKTKKVSKLFWLTSRQPGGVWLSRAGLLRAEGWRPWLMHSWCDGETRPSSEKRDGGGRGVAPLKADVPQGYILMHDGRNKIKQNGIKPSSGGDWWAGGGCCSPLAMLNLMRALPSICLCFTIRNSHRCPERKRPVLRCSKEILAHRHIRFNSAGHKMGTWLPFEGNSLTLAGSLKEYRQVFWVFFFLALLLLFCGLFLKHSCCPTVLLFFSDVFGHCRSL